jgi:hypothetical protein
VHRAELAERHKNGRTLLFVFLAVVVLCFAAACFAFIRAITNWPMWVQIVIALPMGLRFFLCWAKAHETNGFDGIGVDESAKDREDENRGGPAAT